MKNIPTQLNFPNWHFDFFVRDQIDFDTSYFLFDSCVIINIAKANGFYEFFAKEFSSKIAKTLNFSTLKLAYSEFMATTNRSEKKEIEKFFFSKFENKFLPIDKKVFDYVDMIQDYLLDNRCQPAITDLYLGAMLARYEKSEKLFLLTSNMKDFPSPLFEKVGFIILEIEREMSIVGIIRINIEELAQVRARF